MQRVDKFCKQASERYSVWAELCERLWRDKVYVPERFRHSLRGGEAPAGGLEPDRALRAYRESLADARRTWITSEELCGFAWSSRVKGWAGEDWTHTDP